MVIPTAAQSAQLRDVMSSLRADLEAAEDNLRVSKQHDIMMHSLAELLHVLSPFQTALCKYVEDLESTIRVDGDCDKYTPVMNHDARIC